MIISITWKNVYIKHGQRGRTELYIKLYLLDFLGNN